VGILVESLSVLGLALMIHAMVSEKWSHSVISAFFGSLVLGLAVAESADPRLGLAILIIYSGSLTALTYLSSILLGKREAALPLSYRALGIVAIPLVLSAFLTVALQEVVTPGPKYTQPITTGELESYALAIALGLLVSLVVIITLLVEERK